MGMSGIAAVVALAALGGGWSSRPTATANVPADRLVAAAFIAPADRPVADTDASADRSVVATGAPTRRSVAAVPGPVGRSGVIGAAWAGRSGAIHPARAGRPGATAPEPAGRSRPGEEVSVGGPELRLAGSVSPDPMVVGGQSAYTVTVTNVGGRDAEGVTVSDTLDPATVPGPLPGDCSLTGRTITCGGPGLTIPAGESVTYEIPVMVDPSLPDGTDVTNRARVSASRAAGDATQVISRTRTMADVEIAMVGPPAVRAGDGITYRLTITNHGPSPATDVTVQDPADGDRTTVTGRPAECPGGGPAVTCPLGTLAPRESRTLAFTVTPDGAGPIDTCATVSTGSAEERTGNNRSCTSTAVKPVRTTQPESPTPAADRTEAAIIAHTPADRPTAGRKAATGVEPREPDLDSEEDAGPDVPQTVPAGGAIPKPEPRPQALPMTGVSLWLLLLGVPVLLAIGLLVHHFSRRDRADGEGRAS
jgi:uncharacterized repeat protein (TIGR01451 family)